ncbi:hypothetical protein ACFFRK_37290, partial [Amorphoplanes digitatis]
MILRSWAHRDCFRKRQEHDKTRGRPVGRPRVRLSVLQGLQQLPTLTATLLTATLLTATLLTATLLTATLLAPALLTATLLAPALLTATLLAPALLTATLL